MRINKISTEEKVTVGNGKEIKEEKMFDINIYISFFFSLLIIN